MCVRAWRVWLWELAVDSRLLVVCVWLVARRRNSIGFDGDTSSVGRRSRLDPLDDWGGRTPRAGIFSDLDSTPRSTTQHRRLMSAFASPPRRRSSASSLDDSAPLHGGGGGGVRKRGVAAGGRRPPSSPAGRRQGSGVGGLQHPPSGGGAHSSSSSIAVRGHRRVATAASASSAGSIVVSPAPTMAPTVATARTPGSPLLLQHLTPMQQTLMRANFVRAQEFFQNATAHLWRQWFRVLQIASIVCASGVASLERPTWMPDEKAHCCRNCQSDFTWMTRRHHVSCSGTQHHWSPPAHPNEAPPLACPISVDAAVASTATRAPPRLSTWRSLASLPHVAPSSAPRQQQEQQRALARGVVAPHPAPPMASKGCLVASMVLSPRRRSPSQGLCVCVTPASPFCDACQSGEHHREWRHHVCVRVCVRLLGFR